MYELSDSWLNSKDTPYTQPPWKIKYILQWYAGLVSENPGSPRVKASPHVTLRPRIYNLWLIRCMLLALSDELCFLINSPTA